MKKGMNLCIISGKVTGTPLISKTSEGNPFALFKIISNVPKPTIVQAACLGTLTGQIKPYLKDNSRLELIGHLGTSKNGVQVAVTDFLNFNSVTANPKAQSKPQQKTASAPKSTAPSSEAQSKEPDEATLKEPSVGAMPTGEPSEQSPSASSTTSSTPEQSTAPSSKSNIISGGKKMSSDTPTPFDSGNAQIPRSGSNYSSSSSDDLPF